MPNRLANETSPYLLQHRDNPVDWYPWGEEALERARREDRPILLSIGYSACHWCHVMERESFEDEETARVMNEHFVNVKVDREERPDIDSLYMSAVQQMTGHGGWPMTVFLTPAGAPFYGGTYFPPEPRHGLPSFRQVLLGVGEAWRERRDQVQQSASTMLDSLRESSQLRGAPAPLATRVLDTAWTRLAARFDSRNGGFGGAPKFPQPMLLEFGLRRWRRTGDSAALEMVHRTLLAMARGGLYDQLGGGFHRYTVDAAWLVPHFEKMLYDNALLARAYLHGYQATGDAELRRVVEETLDYATREMRHERGGFFSAQDADSEGEEGRFYVWQPEEVDRVLGEDGPLFRAFYDVTDTGNWEGRSILRVLRPPEEFAREQGEPPGRVAEVLARGRAELYRHRSGRVWPGRDEKVLTSWNAMMLQSFAEAGRVMGREDYLHTARTAADFLLRELRPEGRLLRTWKEGTARIDAFLEDHALLCGALLALYEATFDHRHVLEARTLAEGMLERFWDDTEGVFYDTAEDAERLVLRPRDFFDNATPSGGSAAVSALLRLAELTGEARYERVAVRVLENHTAMLAQLPQAFGELLCALELHLAPPRELAVVGPGDDPRTRALLEVAGAAFRPEVVVALLDPTGGAEEARAAIPLLREREMVEHRPTAYVCRRFTCLRPTTDPDELAAQLDA